MEHGTNILYFYTLHVDEIKKMNIYKMTLGLESGASNFKPISLYSIIIETCVKGCNEV